MLQALVGAEMKMMAMEMETKMGVNSRREKGVDLSHN